MLCVQVLGPIGADIDGAPVRLGSPRQRAVLALLLANRGRVVPVDRLIDRLWRGRPPEKAAASLHVYVSNLRRVLEPGRAPRSPAGVLVSAAPGYAVRLPEDAVDAWRFEAAVRRARTAPPAEARHLLEEAIGWWHGAAYGEWADEEWAVTEAARLTDLHLTARELAIGATLASGAPAEAVPAAEALVREHPLREEGRRLLALGLWAVGRRADALAELRRAAAVMAEELGLGLGDALTELENALLTGRTEFLRASVPPTPAPLPAVPHVPLPHVGQAPGVGANGTGVVPGAAERSGPVPAGGPGAFAESAGTAVVVPAGEELFVGRDGELRKLAEVARDARRGGGVVLVTGEAGAGKSALLGQYRRRLRQQGWTVVVGRCPEFDGAPSAWAWVEALGELAHRVPPTDPAALGALLQEAGGFPGPAGGLPGPDGGLAGPDGGFPGPDGGLPGPGGGLAGPDGGLAGLDGGLAGPAGGLASPGGGLAGPGGGLAGPAGGLAGPGGGFPGPDGGLPGPGGGLAGPDGEFPGPDGGLPGPGGGLAGPDGGLAGLDGGLAGPAGGLASPGGGLAGPAGGLAGPGGGLAGPAGRLAGPGGGLVGADGGKASAGRFRLHRAFGAWLRDAAAAAPLAVVVDDLHRADGETLALLERAAELVGSPVLVIAAYRPADAADRLTKTLAELAHRSPYRLALGGLPLPDVATLVGAVCGEPVDAAIVSALAERTGGNPFYVRESARLLAGEGALVAVSEVPQGVRDVLRRRLRQLPEGAPAVLQLASVVGRETEVGVLVEASDPAQHDEHEVLDAVEAAVVAGLLTEPAPGVVRFAHALVRDTLYTDLVGVRRARLHARLAEVLRRRRPDDLAALAHHFARAANGRTATLAVEYSLGAADLAERRYAHDTAVELLTQAIESFALIPAGTVDGESGGGREGRLVALLGRLLRAEIRAGAIMAARHTRQRALAAAEGVGKDELAAAALGASMGPERLPGTALSGPWGLVEPAALDTFVDRLLARADLDPAVLSTLPHRPADERDDVEGGVGFGSDVERAAEVARRLGVARAVGDPLLLASALTVASVVTPDGSPDRRAALATELRVLGYAHDLPANSWVREHIGAMAAGARNDVAQVRRHTEEGRTVARRHRLAEAEAMNLTALAMLARVEGRFADSEAGYAEVRERLRSRGSPYGDFVHVLGLTTVRLAQGRPREAEPLLRALLTEPEPTAELALAVVLARLGEHEQAHALGRRTEAAEPLVPDHLYGIALSLRAELAFLLGDMTAALELIPLLLPLRSQLAGAASVSFTTRPFAHSLGELHRLLGDEASAARQFALAEDVARQWGSSHLVAAARATARDTVPRR
ncbi:BTAD domain-containing putative transcriptional regulator [Streptomyces sp. NPDC007851]|uniref:BTAD domain-containing putative transcriptional regulator n=1 Tax=Streptomyces sp. NPDC007851 TaxID=3155008 RepID=UPI0033EA7B0E